MSSKRSVKSRWKQVFKRDSAKAKESNNLAEYKPTDVPANSAGHVSYSNSVEVSTSTASLDKQSTANPSTLIPAASEKICLTGTKNKENRAPGVSETAGVAAPNPIQKQATDIIVTETSHTSLWDEAYDSLKQERPELLSAYEDLLSRVLISAEANSRSVPNQEGDAIDVRNQIPQHNAAARRGKPKLIAELCFKHIEGKKIKLTILGHVLDVRIWSVINYDNWSDQLKLLKEEETILAEKFERALPATGVQQLKKMAKDAE
ncbi:hypothetical protein IFM51744_08267 [Aspergillus udagawae]|nr:hypothetical protein IFM51744_08267 [Aspergillus udagawae]